MGIQNHQMIEFGLLKLHCEVSGENIQLDLEYQELLYFGRHL